MRVIFFFNDTATTEIYTDCHTLSLHDALPISRRNLIRPTAIEAQLRTRYTIDTVKALRRRYPRHHFIWLMGADNLAQFGQWRDRSEEHTSELQSLMRISYAVFCLNKKTHTPTTNHQSTYNKQYHQHKHK